MTRSRALLVLCCTLWQFTSTRQALGASILQHATHHKHASVLRGGPHGPDGRAYDVDRIVRVPDEAKSVPPRPSAEVDSSHRLVIPSADHITRATSSLPEHLTAGPSIQPLYLKGCPSEDYAAVANLGTGRGKQSFALLVDSGSSTLAVASEKCRDCGVSPGYALISGTTANVPVTAYYGSGAWRGAIVTDTVALGFAPAKRMSFGDILTQRNFFRQSTCTFGVRGPSLAQGIVGLGPSDLLLPGTGSYFMSITSGLQEPTYSVALCDLDGYLQLGPAGAGAVGLEPLYTPMVPSYYYAVGLADLEVGSQPLGGKYDDFGPAVVDTGTSAIILPPRAYNAFTSAVAAATDNALPPSFFDDGDCVELPEGTRIGELNSRLPSLGFAFYNPATPKEPSWVSLPATGSYLLLLQDAKQRLLACAGVVNSGEEYPQTILGNTIMRNMSTTFDLANGRIGFAPTQHICE